MPLLLAISGILVNGRVWAQDNFPLAAGPWARLGITNSGIYKIDQDFIKKIGWNASQVDPRTLKIYGNGGQVLPQSNAIERPGRPLEIPAWLDGGEDGHWNASVALYFYGESPHTVRYNNGENVLEHQKNPYCDTTFYFITFGAEPGLRIPAVPSTSDMYQEQREYYVDYWFQETERYNLLQSGRDWWGEYLGGSSLALTAEMPDLMPASSLRIDISAIASAQVATALKVALNGQPLGEAVFGTVAGATYTARAAPYRGSFDYRLAASPVSSLKFTLEYDRKGQLSAQSFLDFISIQARRKLVAYPRQQFYHFLPAKSDIMQTFFSQASSSWQLWNITLPSQPRVQQLEWTPSGAGFVQAGHSQYQQFIGFNKDKVPPPVSGQQIANQNLKIADHVELIIVTAPPFWKEAQRLAQHRKQVDGLESQVVTTTQIFNQYASGKVDPTAIRDFLRDIYQAGNLKYLLLFGDATYDYKNNLNNQTPFQRGSWVPTYESRESILPIYTYASDDYFGFLDRDEGDWGETVAGDHLLDIGIGRLPVRNQEEAEQVVDKLINYQGSNSKGPWRSRITFVADDGDGEIHQSHASQLANLIDADFLTQKIFIDEYPQPNAASGQHAPQASKLIQSTIDRGALILNYTGHGGVNGWAQEQILSLPDMIYARGYNNLPVLVTATCDFGRYDDMAQVSGAELMVLSPRGAAIAALSTTRPVYASTNFTLNKALYNTLAKTSGQLRLGDLVRQTKNNALVGSLNRNFTLLGDPSMLLIDRNRLVQWHTVPDTLRPGETVCLSGQVTWGETGTIDKDFNGKVYLTLFDKFRNFTTLGDEGEKMEYQDNRDKLYEGTVSVRGGLFELVFIVPMDARTDVGWGRMSAYALSEGGEEEAQGQCPVLIGGQVIEEADTPTELAAYMNDPSFRDGDLVDPSSVMVVRIRDKEGINLVGSPYGRGLTLTLNDTLEIDLSDFYRAELDDFTAGSIVYPFKDLPQGTYTATVKVYDSYNNSSKITFGFEVGAIKGVAITDLVIFPNPFQNDWSFDLEHNRVDEDIALELKVLTISGKVIGEEKWIYYNAPAKLKERVTAQALTNGLHINQLYIYMLSIKSLKDYTVARSSGRIMRSP
ncbi:type IX secretion system sortase PorU [Dyadobacter tibetensis]|uniref:type IX secretion system sortase PorU n=1 Tax=Dyadobacter tibetensis TaxID=1211851 RepID=UPI0004729C7F|nr:type IX secretion system sortase PorU [Dyadobacter tibetensis]